MPFLAVQELLLIAYPKAFQLFKARTHAILLPPDRGLALIFVGIRRFLLQSQVVSLAAVLSICSWLCMQNPAFAKIQAKGNISNFENYAPNLYRGAQPSLAALKDLQKKGVKTIISLRLSKDETKQEREFCKVNNIRFVHIPMSYKTPEVGDILAFLGVVTNKDMQPVYLHCRYGSDRTGAMVGLYRVIVQNWSYEEAYAEMKEHHFKSFLLPLKHAVRDYAKSKPADKERILANSRLAGQL